MKVATTTESKKLDEDERLLHQEATEQAEEKDGQQILCLHGMSLLLVSSYLTIKEILLCLQVCKQWQKDIDNDHRDVVWKEAIKIRSPYLVQCMEKRNTESLRLLKSSPRETQSNTTTATTLPLQPIFDYKTIAKNLVYKSSPQNTGKAQTLPASASKTHKLARTAQNTGRKTEPLPRSANKTHKLTPKDILVFIEIKDMKTDKVIGSWCQPIEKYDFSSSEKIKMIVDDTQKAKLPRSSKELPKCFNGRHWGIPKSIYSDIGVTIRIFRCDTGQSLCWSYERSLTSSGFIKSERKQPDVTTDAGIRTKRRWEEISYETKACIETIWCVIAINITPVGNPSSISSSSPEEIQYQFNFIDFYVHGFDMKNYNYHYGFTFERMPILKTMEDLLTSLVGLSWH